jgi:hypothetical protein
MPGHAGGVVEHGVNAAVSGVPARGRLGHAVTAVAEHLGQGGIAVAVDARGLLGQHGPDPALSLDDADG